MNDTATVIDNTVKKVENAITILADQLGLASDHFYPVLVEQQVLEGWVYIWSALPLFLFASFLAIGGTMNFKNDTDSGWLIAIGIACYIISIVIFGANITHILNPEYHALMEIKEFIK